LVEFTASDVVQKDTVSPRGNHGDRTDLSMSSPRGRVYLRDGIVKIYVGINCPDKTIDAVVDEFELGKYRGTLQVVRDDHWDGR
jgi:hypothetical protein